MSFNRCKQTFVFALVLAFLAVNGLYAQVDPTSIEAVRAAILAGSTEHVARLNADRITQCDTARDNFNLNNQSGQDHVNKTPPLAPFAWELAPADKDGLVFYRISTTQRVTCTHEINLFNAFDASQVVKPANFIDIGSQLVGMPGWYVVGPLDTFPSGQTTPPMPPDGKRCTKWGAPVGRGWYQCSN